MEIEFRRLTIENFKSFQGEHILDFNDRGPGLHFVSGYNEVEPDLGSNGAGKSSLWDAVYWCLYGKTLRDLRNPAIVPWSESGKTAVCLDLCVDGDAVSIKRTISPNRFMIAYGDGDFDDADPDEVVHHIIGLSETTFPHAIVNGQVNPLFLDLKPRDQVSLFAEILDLDYWLLVSDHAKTTATDLQTKLHDRNIESGELRGYLAVLQEKVDESERQSKEWAGSRQDKLTKKKSERTTVTKQISGIEQSKKTFDANLKKREKAYYDLAEKKEAIEDEITDKREQAVITGAKKAEHERRSSEVRDELKRLRGSPGKCYVCGQVLKSKAQITRHRKKLETDLQILEEKDVPDVEAIEGKIEELQIAKTEVQTEMGDWYARVEKTRKAIADATSSLADLRTRKTVLDASIKELSKTRNPYKKQLEQAISDLNVKRDKYDNLQERIEALTARIERTRYWVRGFKEIRLMILGDVLDHLEVVTNANLNALGLIGWRIHYALERETKTGSMSQGFNISVDSPYNSKPVPWQSWSGGEAQRLRLAASFALAEVLLERASVSPNLEIWDEPTTHTSPEGIQDLCELLAERADRLGKIIMYSDHQTIESVLFSSVIEVTKDTEGSHIG